MIKIPNTTLAVFQLMNEISANNFIASLDYLFYLCAEKLTAFLLHFFCHLMGLTLQFTTQHMGYAK
jgi:hypothetical protein